MHVCVYMTDYKLSMDGKARSTKILVKMDHYKHINTHITSPVETNITFVLEFTHITTENLVSR